MNKKQKNKKEVKQNLRNKLINRHYKSSIKNLTKILKKQIKQGYSLLEKEDKIIDSYQKPLGKLFSIIDKAAKKKVIHKNNASRKKSRIIKFFKLHHTDS